MDGLIALLLLTLMSSPAHAATADDMVIQRVSHYDFTGTYHSIDPVSGDHTGFLELEELEDGRLKFDALVSRTSEDCKLNGIASRTHHRWQQWTYYDPDGVCQLNFRRKGNYIHMIPGSLLDCRKRCPVAGGFAMVFPVKTSLASK